MPRKDDQTMLSLNDRDAVTAALTDPSLDPTLRALIGLRVWQVDTDRRRPLGEILQIVVVQPSDPPEVIHAAVGFPICWDQAEQPGWEWFNDHGSWFELAYVLTDDFGMLVFVADHPDTNDTLRFNCLGFADRPPTSDAD
ncbi:hypothetical protein QOZ96_002062 [Brevundimonas nasdae]|uniref:hypothetical protein n=1 Tax=Brevundimonas nasdae TaxID=172043 RepID=UPI001914952E|nr:hypothetical protein [Brevundimonas nasdae]MBK6025482.1 hypothetical protein [Brevundimonas nasdae]MDQ0452112.1 hypothetical protein [Brevundimonas nasdae]